MIRLEHINLVITDMESTLAFYTAAFPDYHIRSEGEGTWYGTPRRWLHFGDDYTYLAFSDHGQGNNRDLKGRTPGLAHIAFEVTNLTALKARMAAVGYDISTQGTDNPHRDNIYYLDPDGHEVEFVVYHSDLVAERNNDSVAD